MDFDIKAEDMTKLSEWLSTDHSDIKDLMAKSASPVDVNMSEIPQQLEQVLTKIKKAESAYDESLEHLSDGINKIIRIDRNFTIALSSLISYLSSTYSDKYENAGKPNMSKDFLMSSDSPDVALFNALKYIQRYTTKGFKKSGNPVDLLKAIHYCLFELQRIQTKPDND